MPGGDRRRLRVGVSSCLLGNRVRYDGGHKKSDSLARLIAPYADFVPVCPEAEIGLGTPREPVRLLMRADQQIRLEGVASGVDHTARMERYARATAERLCGPDGVDGFVFMDRSPSCGLSGVPVLAPDGAAEQSGPGLFAAAITLAAPDLPVAEESRLRAAAKAEAFIERMRAYRRSRSRLR